MFVKRLIGVAAITMPLVLPGCLHEKDMGSMTEPELTAYAMEIHERAITIDTHTDIPVNFATAEVDPGDPNSNRPVTLPKMREGRLDVCFFAVFVRQGERTPDGHAFAYDQSITVFDAIHRMAEEMYPEEIEIAYRSDDVERIIASGKLVASIGMENGYPIGRDLSKIAEFYDRGCRYITLVHSGHNEICDSNFQREGDPVSVHDGVSEFGKKVIAEMNRLGIMVDIAHASTKSRLDALALSKAPVIISHGSAFGVNSHPRNIIDDELLALKKNGGVMHLMAERPMVRTRVETPERKEAVAALHQRLNISLEPHVKVGKSVTHALIDAVAELPESDHAQHEKTMTEIDQRFPPSRPVDVKDFVDHVDYVVELIGIDHVGMSSDFGGYRVGGVDGWEHEGQAFNVTVELVRRGYTDEQIRKIWGGNLLRVWKEVERTAEELQKTPGN